jgi:purine catabolism regulator
MRLRDALAFESLADAEVVAGHDGLDRELQWIHCVDLPDPRPWVSSGQLLLTTAAAWPKAERAERQLIADLHARGLVAIGIPAGHYLDHFSPACREVADALGFPLLEIANETPWADITREVHQALLEQDNDIAEAAQLFAQLTHAASESSGLQYLADVLGGILARHVVVTSIHGHVLAACDVEGEPPILAGLSEAGVLPPALLAALRATEQYANLQAGTGPSRLPGIRELGMQPVTALPLALRGRSVAVLWISESRGRLSPKETMLCEHAASVAAIQLAHQNRVAAVAAKLGGDLMETLLRTGRLDGPEETARAQLLGLNVNAIYRVGIVRLPGPGRDQPEAVPPMKQARAALARRLGQVGAPTAIAVGDRDLTFLMPNGIDPESALGPMLHHTWSAVLSQAHDGLIGLPEGAREARMLLRHAAPGRIERFESLLISRILLGDADAREPFLEGLFGDLRRVRGGDQIVATVLELAKCGFARNRAATALHVHANTLRYRLTRAEQVSGMNLADPETQFRLQLAARLLDLPAAGDET